MITAQVLIKAERKYHNSTTQSLHTESVSRSFPIFANKERFPLLSKFFSRCSDEKRVDVGTFFPSRSPPVCIPETPKMGAGASITKDVKMIAGIYVCDVCLGVADCQPLCASDVSWSFNWPAPLMPAQSLISHSLRPSSTPPRSCRSLPQARQGGQKTRHDGSRGHEA